MREREELQLSFVMLESKFDRQVRLWGIDGQDVLRTSSVIALGCTSTITSALKSLILAGVGHVLIVDEQTVRPHHISTNFFVNVTSVSELSETTETSSSTLSSIKLLAEVVAQELRELNDACDVEIVNKHPERYVEEDLSETLSSKYNSSERTNGSICVGAYPYHRSRTVILVSNRYTDFTPCSEVCTVCRKYNVDVICVDNCGMLGFLQIYGKDSVFMTELNAPEIAEIRNWNLFYPFNELRNFYNSYTIPSISLLYFAFIQWNEAKYSSRKIFSTDADHQEEQQQHSSQMTLSEKERVEICEIYNRLYCEWCKEQSRYCTASCNSNSEARNNNNNVRETIYKYTQVLKKPNVLPRNVQELLSCDKCANPIYAVKEFTWYEHSSSSTEESLTAMVNILHLADVLVWYVLFGVKKFCEENSNSTNVREWWHQCLPFSGILPNVTSMHDYCINHSDSNLTLHNENEKINAISHAIKQICETKHCHDVKCVTELSWHKLCEDWPFLLQDVTLQEEQTRLCEFKHVLLDNVALLAKRVAQTIYSMHVVSFHALDKVPLSLVTNITTWERTLHDNYHRKWSEHVSSFVNNRRNSNKNTVNYDDREFVLLCFQVAMFARHVLRRSRITPCHECKLYTVAMELIGTTSLDSQIPSRLSYDNAIITTTTRTTKNSFVNKCTNNTTHNVESTSDCYTDTSLDNTHVQIEEKNVINWEEENNDNCYKVLRDCCQEVNRTRRTEFVPVSNILGALAAQESIKLIQRQRIPINAP